MKLKNIATPKLRRELARREAGAVKLRRRHGRLAKALAAIERNLLAMGVGAMGIGGGNIVARGRSPGGRNKRRGRRGPGRPKGSKNKPGKVGRPKGSKNKRAKSAMSLVEAIRKGVRAGSTVSPAEAGAAARKVGYKSSSPNFGMMVANALSKDSHFKRIERGQYLVRGGKASAKPTSTKAVRKPKRAGRKPGKAKKAKPSAKATASTALAEVVAR